jgi:hypothetical protein
MSREKSAISYDSEEMEQRLLVEAELERILQSSGFRTSRRSQEFLRYIVCTALDGRLDDLKERIIGHVVFHRLPDYDTGEHSIVRVKANELRKRLAQFYSEANEPSSVQIHLPRGSYTPEFRWMSSPKPVAVTELINPVEGPQRPVRVHLRLRFLIAGIISALLVCGSAVLFENIHAAGVEDRFWGPVFQDANSPLICVADPEVLKLNDRYAALAFNGALPANVPSSELVHDSSHYVGWGDALALTQLSTFFALHHKQPEIRNSADVSYTELTRAPVVLIGARSNPWTMQLANNLRFVFERSDTQSYIRDTEHPGKQWTFQLGPPKVDYIVVSRVFESKTGKMIVLAAGLSHFGTQVAGELLTNPALLDKALRGAPKDWPNRNMQLLFRVEVFGNTAGSPVLEASKFW